MEIQGSRFSARLVERREVMFLEDIHSRVELFGTNQVKIKENFTVVRVNLKTPSPGKLPNASKPMLGRFAPAGYRGGIAVCPAAAMESQIGTCLPMLARLRICLTGSEGAAMTNRMAFSENFLCESDMSPNPALSI